MAISAWQAARRVLCVRLDSLGDVLMSTPAMRALKRSRPGRKLALLTSQAGAQLEGLLPDVDEVLVYDAPWMKTSPASRDGLADCDWVARLRRAGFDAAVIFTVFSQSPLPAALACYLAGIPLRLAHCRENPYHLLTDWVAEDEPEKQIRHEVRRQLDLVSMVACHVGDERLALSVPEAAIARVRGLLLERGLDGRRPWIAIHSGATAPSRRYPPELYAQVTSELTRRHGFQAVFTGVETERPLIDLAKAEAGRRAISLAGELTLAELVALVAMAPVLLANNTGPVHVAAAVGTPVVDLYALTNPQHTPWMVPHRVLYHDVPCKYCFKSTCPVGHHRCLRGIEPSSVVAAVLELYEETAAWSQVLDVVTPGESLHRRHAKVGSGSGREAWERNDVHVGD